jgi:2'-5' RNA ligase
LARTGKGFLARFSAIELTVKPAENWKICSIACPCGLQDVAWVKPGAMPLTLQFLGEYHRNNAEKLQERYGGASMDAFLLRLQSGAFPSPHAPLCCGLVCQDTRNWMNSSAACANVWCLRH